jgi:hypothetical protein
MEVSEVRPGIYLEGLMKTLRNLSLDIHSLDGDLNPGPPQRFGTEE